MALEFRKTVRADYPDVITDDAVRVHGGAGALRRRAQADHGGAHRAACRSRAQARAHRLSRSERASSPARRSRSRMRARATSSAPRSRTTCSGSGSRAPGPAARPGASVEVGLRNVAYALLERRRRLDVRRRGRARPGVDDVARQPAQPEAGDPSRSDVPGGRRAGRRRDEQVGDGLLRQARSSPTGASSSISRPRSFAPAACISTIGTSATPTAPASPPRSSTRRSTSSTTIGG